LRRGPRSGSTAAGAFARLVRLALTNARQPFSKNDSPLWRVKWAPIKSPERIIAACCLSVSKRSSQEEDRALTPGDVCSTPVGIEEIVAQLGRANDIERLVCSTPVGIEEIVAALRQDGRGPVL
jgi:hypothetical protein